MDRTVTPGPSVERLLRRLGQIPEQLKEKKMMNIRDLSADDILNAMGLQTRRTTTDYMLPALGIFGVGVLVGAGIGMLFAPKSGSEIRTHIGSMARRHKNGEDEGIDITRGEAAE
jgi:hypothetical protein